MSPPTAALTKKDQVDEILRCGRDPVYFMRKYAKIQHPKRGTIPFETYSFQDECVTAFQENRFNIILKSRQLGLSTVTAAYATWFAIFHKDKNVLVIATKLQTAMGFVKKVKVILDNLPKWLMLTKFEPTKQSISFANGSVITAVPTSPDAGRSEALSLLIVDEAAFIRDFEDIWTGLYPTISTGGSAIILSTPHGVGGTYYRIWTEAEAKVNEFNSIRLEWWKHPEHDQAWFDKETKNLPKRKVGQEFLCVGADTKIVTPDGYKRADEIKIDDLVLTHMGRFKPVLNVNSRLVRMDETLYEVSSPGSRKCKFTITGNHKMLSYRFWANNISSYDWLKNNASEQSWIEASVIASKRKTTDRITNVLMPKFDPKPVEMLTTIDVSTLCPSIDVTNDTCRYERQWGNTKRYVSVDFELGKFIGLYLAEGCNHRGGVDLGFHIDELETHAKWCIDFLHKIGCRTTLLSSKIHNSCRLWTFNRHIGALVKLFIQGDRASNGRWAPNKRLDMERVVASGREFIKGLLFGHHLGDGNHKHDKKTCTYSTSSKLIFQLRTLNTMFGLYPRIGHVELKKKNPRHSDMWYLEFQAQGTTYLGLLENGQQYRTGSRTMLLGDNFVGHHQMTDVSHLSMLDGGYEVYDISVADDKSFVAQSAVLHNCDFISSGDTFLQPEDLEYLRETIEPPSEKSGPQLCVWTWRKPQPAHLYVISADVARGDSSDFSAFHIIDRDTCEVAAEYMGKIPPDKFADLLAEYGKLYNTALICPEQNTFGYMTCVRLRDMGYPKLYFKNATGDLFEYKSVDPDAIPGFSTQSNTRVQILSKLEELIRTKVLKTYSQRLYDQMQAFVWVGSRAQAANDAHDDLILSLAIGTWLTNGGTSLSEAAIAMAYAMMKATKIERRDISQMPGDIQSAKPLVNPNIRGYNAQNVYKPVDPSMVKHADISDFSWLLK